MIRKLFKVQRGKSLGQCTWSMSLRVSRDGHYCPVDLLLRSKQITFSLLKLFPGYVFNLYPSFILLPPLLFCRLIVGSHGGQGSLFGQWKPGKTATGNQDKGIFHSMKLFCILHGHTNSYLKIKRRAICFACTGSVAQMWLFSGDKARLWHSSFFLLLFI